MKRAHSLRISSVAAQGSDAILLGFELSHDQKETFGFQPGQYLTVGGGEAGQVWRCYSITSEPEALDDISVLVRRVAGGQLSNWLCDNAKVGEKLEVLPPAGSFFLRRKKRPVVLYAGGSGIGPIISLARQALRDGAPIVRLFYANRDDATTMLKSELLSLASNSGGCMEIRFWSDAESGLPTADDLSGQVSLLEDFDIYVCGPQPFMKAVFHALGNAGHDPARIFSEDFGAAVAEPDADDDGEERCLTVLIKGASHTLKVRSKETLLAAMLRNRLSVPHACKVGECASCTCRLADGEVERLENSVLDEGDVADGWLLACRTYAAGESVTVRFL